MHARTLLSLAAAFAALSHAAHAQVVPTTGVAKYYSTANTGTFLELPGAEVTPMSAAGGGNMQFFLSGDVRLNLDPNDDPDETQRWLEIGGVRQFTVGAFPTQITPEADVQFKIVNAGGPEFSLAPFTTGQASLLVYQRGSYVHGSNDFSTLGALVSGAGVGENLQGNGFTIVDRQQFGPSYVLLPDESYTAIWRMRIISSVGGFNPGDPAAAVFYEAGGLSDFEGLFFDLNAVVVPTPGAAALAAMGCVVAARRRNRAA